MGAKFVNGCIYMALLRNPSYREALLKFINLAKKKKTKVQKELPIIQSVGPAEEDESMRAIIESQEVAEHDEFDSISTQT